MTTRTEVGEDAAQLTEHPSSHVVADTSVLIADPHLLHDYPGVDLVVPLTVVEELDAAKSRSDDVGWRAREALREIERIRGNEPVEGVRLPRDHGSLRLMLNGLDWTRLREYGLSEDKADNRILAAALGLQDGPGRVVVLSNDAAMRIKATQVGLEAQEHTPLSSGDDVGPGWVEVDVAKEVIDQLYRERSLPEDAVGAADGFAVLRAGASQSALARWADGAWHPLPQGEAPRPQQLTARNVEQRFALELLCDPEVKAVALEGIAGTGKTLLALAAGLEQVADRPDLPYQQLGVYRPVVPLGRQDLGFLPGTIEEKLDPWMDAVLDNLAVLTEDRSPMKARQLRDALTENGTLAVGSIAHIRGRSIPRAFIIVDEAQNLEPAVAKALLTRVGEDTKIVFTGDPSQVDSPYLSPSNNALATLRSRLDGQPCFGRLQLSRGERSEVATLAAALL